MRKLLTLSLFLLSAHTSFCWGFYAHRKINQYAVFLLPPEMMVLYKTHIAFLEEHAVDPDKRRYAIPEEGPRHYIDIDHYGIYPYESLPRKWNDAVTKYSEDTLNAYGIVPWWLQTMLYRLTDAFKEKNQARILKLSAEIGRIPELLAEKEWDFFIGKAEFIKNPADFIWARVMESAAAADTVLKFEKDLSHSFPSDQRFAFEDRNGQMVRQYSSSYSKAYNDKLKGMVERRMRQSIFAVASFWYTAWVNAGQPDLAKLSNKNFSPEDLKEFESLNNAWKNNALKDRDHE